MNDQSQANKASQFMMQGIDLEADILRAANRNRELSKAAYKREWLDSRLILLSVLWNVLEYRSGIPGISSEDSSKRLSLITIFIQGVGFTENAISEGFYPCAAALLKQDYEILARIGAIKGGMDKPGKTPNVRHAPSGSQHFYGQLNNLAHPSTDDILEQSLLQHHNGDVHGLSHIPTFVEQIGCSMYELHVWLILEIVREAILLSQEMYPDSLGELSEPLKYFVIATDNLKQAGFVIKENDLPK